MGFWARTFITAFALWAATQLVPGIEVRGVFWLLLTALVFGLVNAFVRPVLVLLSLPFTLVTLGLFLLVVNAAMGCTRTAAATPRSPRWSMAGRPGGRW